MNRKLIYKRLCYLLLFAMVVAAVPVHQLFHKHNAGKAPIAQLQLNKIEKPCCKVFEGIGGDITTQQPEFKTQPFFGEFLASFFEEYVSGPFFFIPNKAPPVVIA